MKNFLDSSFVLNTITSLYTSFPTFANQDPILVDFDHDASISVI